MGSLGWAVALSALSAAGYAAAAVVQERLAGNGLRGRRRWAAALMLTGVGGGLHVLALNFGTVAVVQALGTLTLLFALPIARLRYKTKVGLAGWRDAILTVAGLGLVMSLSIESDDPALLSPSAARVLGLVTLGVVAVLIASSRLAGRRVRAVLLASAAGVAFGVSSVVSKAVMAAFTEGGLAEVSLLAAAMVVLLAVGGYLLGQWSYKGAGLAAPLAAVSVTNPIFAAVTGVVVFGESFRFGVVGQLLLAVAAVAMTVGVIGLARRSAATTSPKPPPSDDGQAARGSVTVTISPPSSRATA